VCAKAAMTTDGLVRTQQTIVGPTLDGSFANLQQTGDFFGG